MLSILLSMVDTADKKVKIISLYDRYYPLMCYIAKEALTEEYHSDIDDVVQESLLDLIEYIDNIDVTDEIKAKSLCVIVTKRRAIDHMRKKDNNHLSLDDIYGEITGDTYDPDIIMDKKATLEMTVKAIDKLDETYRDACRLKYIHMMSEKDIARILHITPKAVNMRIMRGKQILRKILRKELYGE